MTQHCKYFQLQLMLAKLSSSSFLLLLLLLSWIVIAPMTLVQAQQQQQRQQQQVSFAGYVPITDVTYQSTIDVAQQQMEDLLSQLTGNRNAVQQDQTLIDEAYTLYQLRFQPLGGLDGTAFRIPSNDNDFLPFFNVFLNYMGSTDYANEIIIAGFNGTVTTSGYDSGFQLVEYNLPGGLFNVIQLSTVLIALVQYIVRNLDVAIDECKTCFSNSDTTSDCGVSLIDEAAAYYVGSLQRSLTNSYEGYLLFGTADRLCQVFDTCDGMYALDSSTTVTTSRVNMIILQQLRSLQSSVQSRLCDDAQAFRNIIVTQLFVPMIQGTIRSTYYTGQQTTASEACNADATMYAASILPLILNCSEVDATSLFDQTDPTRTIKTNASFVNELLLRNLECLGLTANDIGTFNPDTMVEWGRCGQPTPAPIVPQPVTPRPVSLPTNVAPPSRPIPIPIATKPISTSATSAAGWTRKRHDRIRCCTITTILTILLYFLLV
jgi:hypothetical protein